MRGDAGTSLEVLLLSRSSTYWYLFFRPEIPGWIEEIFPSSVPSGPVLLKKAKQWLEPVLQINLCRFGDACEEFTACITLISWSTKSLPFWSCWIQAKIQLFISWQNLGHKRCEDVKYFVSGSERKGKGSFRKVLGCWQVAEHPMPSQECQATALKDVMEIETLFWLGEDTGHPKY